jgi:hypothetical protein
MTPQERELITTLFDRLAALESAPRDPDAERTIADGLARAPHALYPLVQTVLVQDEALKVANARINELQQQASQHAEQPTSFLGGLFGGRSSSVPTVRPADQSAYRNAPAAAQPVAQQAAAQPASSGFGLGGGSFLGTAAAAAAGLVGGSLLLSGIRGLFGGGYGHGPFGGTFDSLGGYGGGPWGGGMGPSGVIDDRGPGGGYAGGDPSDSGPYDSAGGDPSDSGPYDSASGDPSDSGSFDSAGGDPSDFGGGSDSA